MPKDNENVDLKLTYDDYVALCSVIDYLHDDELKHYEEETDIENGEYNKHHIWHSVNTLSLKLREYQMSRINSLGGQND